jgi:hypothetical protein
MITRTITGMFGSARRSDADRHRRIAWSIPVTLRLAAPDDRAGLERLAGLDSSRLDQGPYLVAVRNGTIEAAISLRTHEVLADPFRRTAESCELLLRLAGDRSLGADAASLREPTTRPVFKERLA